MLRDRQVGPTMASLTQQHTRFARLWLSAARLGVFVLLAAGLSVEPTAHAQTSTIPPTRYINDARLKIPFDDPNDPRIVMVHLCVSEDRGKTYERRASARPNQKEFRYTAPGDSIYWLTTQTEDRDGNLYPPNPAALPPMLVLQVHTKKPVIALKQIPPLREGYIAVDWDIRDDFLDPNSLRVEYRPVGGPTWYILPVDRRSSGSYEWNPLTGGAVEVHFKVSNLANTVAEESITLNPNGKAAPPPAPAAPVGVGAPSSDSTIWVNKQDIRLSYELQEGPSGVSKIEIWQCSPTLEWQLLETREKDKAKSPLSIHVPGEGRYGFTLIPISGVDLAMARPMPRDQPQQWIQVDLTPPKVRVQRMEVGRGLDSGNVTIYWDASDDSKGQLAANPISIYYKDPDKPTTPEWTVIAKDLPNSRSYVWKDKEKPYQCFIKIEARDMAGNVGIDVAKEALKVDLKIPTLKIKGIEAAQAGTTPPNPQSP
jgi:hypothetical protein